LFTGQTEWLQTNKTLEEQGVKDDSILLLKKKFFVWDSMVSSDDPVALHLLYVQARDAIVSGHHPVPKNEARDLAALQSQVQEGRYVPEKHIPPYLE
jgi:hypothetical protein